jgi:transposase
VEWSVGIGVETIGDLHVAVAVDRVGRRLGALVIEGTCSYGASLARALLADGLAVYEYERPARRRRKDKNDLLDAELAARRLLAGEPLARQ